VFNLKELSTIKKVRRDKEGIIKIAVSNQNISYMYQNLIINKNINTNVENELYFGIDQKTAQKISKDYYNWLNVEDENLLLKNSDYDLRLKIKNIDEFKKTHFSEFSYIANINTQEFLDNLGYTEYSILKDDDPLSKNLSGIYINFLDKKINFVGSDSYQLSLFTLKNDYQNLNEDNDKNGFILNYRTLETLKKLLKIHKPENFDLKISKDNNYFIIKFKNIELITNVEDVRYPDYLEIISGLKNKMILNLDLKETKKFIKKSKDILGSNANLKMDYESNIKDLTIYSYGRYEDKLYPKNLGVVLQNTPEDDFIVYYGIEKFKKVIDNLYNDNVVIEITGDINPTLIRDNNRLHVIMPTRGME
jgi:DNA polymerase III sliding clamp (beta) subunit (PCNA family)